MIRCYIVLILWILATTIATTPSDNVRQVNNDKNTPRYLYEYSIENDDGTGQGKIETTSGELDSGRYYINNNQSSTDVKYFTDEWGYHPIVQYTSNSDSATSNSHLAFDNHPIYELVNATENEHGIIVSTNSDSNIQSELHTLESLQPPIINNINLYNQSISNGNFTFDANDMELTNDTIFQQYKFTNNSDQYDEMVKLLNTNNTKYESTIDSSFYNMNNEDIESAYSANRENILLKENSGMFGHRLQQNIVQQFYNENRRNPELIYTKNDTVDENRPNVLPLTSSFNYRIALENLRKYLEFNSTGNNDNEWKTYNQDQINSRVELPQFISDTNEQNTNSTDEFKMNSRKESSRNFARPIVVANISSTRQLNYSRVLPCNEEDGELISSTAVDIDNPYSITETTLLNQVMPILTVTPKLQRKAHITTSSIVLNPIQAGVALVNAGKTHLINGNVEPSLAGTVNENGFNEHASMDTNQPLKHIEYAEASQLSNIPLKINPTFDKFETIMNSSQSSLVDDKTVEIQKSLELYHSSPVHEIHYPAQVIPQITSIDQQRHQESSQTTQKHKNAKQTFEQNVESYEENVDLSARNSNTIKSIVNPSSLPLQGIKTSPKSSDLTLSYVTGSGQKLYGNNVEHIKRPGENYIIQNDHSSISLSQENQNPNLFIDTRYNTDLYLPYQSKNSYRNLQPSESSDIGNEKSLKQDTSVIAMQLHPRTQSILQRLLTDSTDVINHFEVDKLRIRDKQLHQRYPSVVNELKTASRLNYHNTQIDLTQQQIPIFTGGQCADGTSVIDNTVPFKQTDTKTANNELSSNIDNTVYIYTPSVNSKVNNIKDYGNILNNPVGKSFHNSVDQETFMRSSAYPIATNRISEKHVPNAFQPYPIASPEKIIQKKAVPYPIHKFVAQTYPVHILEPHTMEKTTSIPANPYNNIITTNSQISDKYPINIPIKISYPVELPKYTEKSTQLPYNIQYGLNYPPILDQYSHKLNNKYEVNSLHLPFPINISNHNSQGYVYVKPVIPFVNLPPRLSKRYTSLNQFANSKQYYPWQQSLNYQPPSKKLNLSQLPFQTHTTANVNHPTPSRWHVTHRTSEKFVNKNTGYLGSVQFAQHVLNVHPQNQVVYPAHQEILRHSTDAPISLDSFLRKTRLPEAHYHGNTGNFRQSKMEYGFKPPLIPSVQYDDETATKVAS